MMKSKMKIVMRAGTALLLIFVMMAGAALVSVSSSRERPVSLEQGASGKTTSEESALESLESGTVFFEEKPLADMDRALVGEAAAGRGAGKSTAYVVHVTGIPLAGAAKLQPLCVYFENHAIVNAELVTEYLHIRKEPEKESEILTAAGLGVVLDVLEEKDGWTRVCADGVTGWAKSDYLLAGDAAAAYISAHADPYAEVAVPNMNIRMGKSISSGILDVAEQGEAFPLIEIEDGWAKVKLDDVLYGYLAGNCVTINYDWNGYVIATRVAGADEDEVRDTAHPVQPSFVHWEVREPSEALDASESPDSSEIAGGVPSLAEPGEPGDVSESSTEVPAPEDPSVENSTEAGGQPAPGNPSVPEGQPTPGNPTEAEGQSSPGNPAEQEGQLSPGNPSVPESQPVPGNPTEAEGQPTPGNPTDPGGQSSPQNPSVPESQPTSENPAVPEGQPSPENPTVPDGQPVPPSSDGSEQLPPEVPTNPPTQPQATEAPTVPERNIIGIEAFYTGSRQKIEGEVMMRAEVCVYVYYDNGSTEIVTEGWTSDDIGMILHAGEEIIAVSYGGFTSNIVLQVAPASPAPTDPAPVEPAPTDPVPAEPAPTDPAPADPVPTDPAPVDPAPTDPVPTDPVPTDPALVDPAPTDPVPSDPVPTDPAPTDPAPVDPALTEPAPTDPAPSDPALTDPAPTDPAPSDPASDEPVEEAYVNNVPLSGELTAYALRLCRQYGVDSAVIFSVMYQESNFNPNAVSGSGAVGLMQIIQRYSQDRMNRLGVTDLYDPKSNMLVGIDMLAEYYYTYGGWVPALTRYRHGRPDASSEYANKILGRVSMFQ